MADTALSPIGLMLASAMSVINVLTDVARKRERWKRHQHHVDPALLVFVDETWAKTNMTRTLFSDNQDGCRVASSRNAPERVEHCLTRMLPAPRRLVNR